MWLNLIRAQTGSILVQQAIRTQAQALRPPWTPRSALGPDRFLYQNLTDLDVAEMIPLYYERCEKVSHTVRASKTVLSRTLSMSRH